MKEPLISVIIPVYRVESYLRKCIDSVIAQTYKNLEIILVDDGSPDACPAICDEYAEKDERIRVIHKENRGVSSARNAGLDICTGDYIAFVDSDDWIETTMYEEMMEMMLKNDLDVVFCTLNFVENGKVTGTGEHYYPAGTICSTETVLRQTLIHEIKGHPYLRLYSRTAWSDLRFPEGRIFEDFAVSFRPFVTAKKPVGFLDRPLYNYVKHTESITGKRKPSLRYNKYLASKDHFDYACIYYPRLADYCAAETVRYAMGTYLDYHCYDWAELKSASEDAECFLQENRKELLKSMMPKSVKLPLCLYYCTPLLFRTFYRVYIKIIQKS